MPSQIFSARARAQWKTGEAYTAARAKLLAKPSRSRTAMKTALSAAPAVDYAKLAGMSDAVVKEKTGCQWDRWVKSLDHHGAAELPHREIVDLVQKKYKVGDWWSQMVTVGYERIKGLRARGQRRDGSYEATKSRTFNVPIGLHQPRVRGCEDASSVAEREWAQGSHVGAAEVDCGLGLADWKHTLWDLHPRGTPRAWWR
jgi:hypothetical protein